MAVTKIKSVKSTLSKALDYIENPDKTDEKMLISSFGCSYETADIVHIASSNGRFCGAKRPQCEANRPQAVAFVI